MSTITSTEAGATGRYINLGSPASQDDIGAQTIIVYCKPATQSVLGYAFAKSDSGGSGARLLHSATNQMSFGASSTGSTLDPSKQSAASAITVGVWQHLQATWDGSINSSGMNLYIDAAAALTGTTDVDGVTGVATDASNDVFILNRTGLGREFVGDVAYVARWGRVLNSTERTNVRANGPLSEPSGLILCWANQQDYSTNAITPTARSTFVAGSTPTNTALGGSELTPSLFTDADTFYAPTVVTAGVLTPTLFVDADTFFTPTVIVAVTITPALFTDSDTFYAPVVISSTIKTLRVRTKTGWSTKSVADLPENRLTAEEVDDTFLGVWERAELTSKVWNAAQFGAVSNTSIQAAVDAASANGGGMVVVDTPGTYVISSPILLPSNSVFYVGHGVTLQNMASAINAQHVIKNADIVSGNTNITICGPGTIDGNKANQSGIIGQCCIALTNCSHSLIKDIEVKNAYRGGTFPTVGSFGCGVALLLCSNSTVFNVRSHDNLYDGIKLRAGQSNSVINCRSWDNGRSGLQIAYNSTSDAALGDENTVADGELDFLVTGNQFWHSTGTPSACAPTTSGIYLHCASYGTITGNRTGGMNQGLGTWGADTGNYIQGNTFSARVVCIHFETAYATYNTVQNNQLLGDGASGKWINDVGVSNVFKDVRCALSDIGTGTWSNLLTGTNARVIFPEPNAVTVTDSGTGSTIIRHP